MSHQEFENYLALLTRLLKVPASQREQLAEELRAHLEDRLDELLARGMTKEQAVPLAIGEFGDAAVLAADLASIAQRKRRRLIMKMSYASAAALALIGLLTFALWPEGRQVPGPANAVAQGQEKHAGNQPAEAIPHSQLESTKRIEHALAQEAEFDFVDTPLRDVVSYLSKKHMIPVMLHSKALEEAAIDPDTPINSNLKGITVRSALRLMLGELGLNYVVRHEVLQITTQDDADGVLVTKVYDCRELLALPRPPGSERPKAVRGGGGFFAVQEEPATKAPPATDPAGTAPSTGETTPPAGAGDSGGQTGGGGFGGGGSGGKEAPQREPSDADNLIQIITTTIEPDSWDEVGGPGTIAEYKGLLAVSQTGDIHHEIERLLNMLHQAAGIKEQRVKVVE